MMATSREGVKAPSHRPEDLPCEPVEVVRLAGMEVKRWDAYSEVDGGYCLRGTNGEWRHFYMIEIDGQEFWRQPMFGSTDREAIERELIMTISLEKRMLAPRRRNDMHKGLDIVLDEIQRQNIGGGDIGVPEGAIALFAKRLRKLIYEH